MNHRRKYQLLIPVVILFLLSGCVSTTVPPRLTPPPEGTPPIVPRPVDSFEDTYVVGTDGALYEMFWRHHRDEIVEIEKHKILDDVVNVMAAQDLAMAIQADGTLWGWGIDLRSRLPEDRDAEIPVAILEDVVDVSSNAYYSLALKRDGTVWAFGSIFFMPWGYQGPVPMMEDAVQIGGGGLVVKSDGTLWGWGMEERNIEGELRYEPILITDHISKVAGWAERPVRSLAADLLVIKEDGSLWSIPRFPDGGFDLEHAVRRMDHTISAGSYHIASSDTANYILQEDGTLWTCDLMWSEPVKVMEQAAAVQGSCNLFITTQSGELWVYNGYQGRAPKKLLEATEWWSGSMPYRQSSRKTTKRSCRAAPGKNKTGSCSFIFRQPSAACMVQEPAETAASRERPPQFNSAAPGAHSPGGCPHIYRRGG